MAKNRTFTGGRRAVGTPTLPKNQIFQLIKKARNVNEGVPRRTPDSRTIMVNVSKRLDNNGRNRTV